MDSTLGDMPESLPDLVAGLISLLAPLECPQADEIRQYAQAIHEHPDVVTLTTETAITKTATAATEPVVNAAPTKPTKPTTAATTEPIANNEATAEQPTIETATAETAATEATVTVTVTVDNANAAANTAPGPPDFKLRDNHMRENLIPTLQHLIDRPDFHNELQIPLPAAIDLRAFKDNLDLESDDCQQATQRYRPGGPCQGHCFVHGVAGGRRYDRFTWPDFSKAVTTLPSIEEAKNWLDQVINDPPEYEVSYYTGHGYNLPFETQLNPGQEILNNPLFKDIHDAYYHIGGDKSAARFHLEDLSCVDSNGETHGLRSANMVLIGVKIWILISPEDATQFYDFVTGNWSVEPKCSRAISHLGIIISPSRLDAENIGYTIKIGYPGNLVITHQAQYHLVINMGPCIAQSINFALRGDSLYSPEQIRCVNDGMAAVAKSFNVPLLPCRRTGQQQQGSSKRKRVAAMPWQDAVPSEKKRQKQKQDKKSRTLPSRVLTLPQPQPNLGQVAVELRRAGQVFFSPAMEHSVPSERVFRLFCALMSRDTIALFYSMVDTWNSNDIHLLQSHKQGLSLAQRAALITKLDSGKHLLHYLQRHHQLHLTFGIEQLRQGRLRLAPEQRRELISQLGWSDSALNYHMQTGRKWIAIHQINHGLLPLLSCYSAQFGVSVTAKQWLSDGEVDEVKAMLGNCADVEAVQRLLGVAGCFVSAVEKGDRVVLQDEFTRNEVERVLMELIES